MMPVSNMAFEREKNERNGGVKVAIIAITEEGNRTARELAASLKESRVFSLSKPRALRKTVEKIFDQYEGIIFIMALGIVVRVIAPHLRNKRVDPAVVVVDESRRFAISALSGHEGGANRLASQVASLLGAEPVITTASDSRKDLIIGVGCRKGTSQREILKAIAQAMKKGDCLMDDVRCISSIDLKRNEGGLKEACVALGLPLRIISADLIKRFNGPYQRSAFVKEKIGVEGVSEPCALLAGRKTKLIVPKVKRGRVCVAIAREG